MKLFLDTLRGAIEAEVPVKVNELFLKAFYSPSVWRRNTETMQQYIIRREQDFRKLETSSPGTSVSENLRAMMLLIFGGLDAKEQVSVLSSVNNEYNFEKISHAMRIQFPNAAGKQVLRRDYLGCGSRGSSSMTPPMLKKWKQTTRKSYAFAAEDAPVEDETANDDEVYYQDDDDPAEWHEDEEALVAESDEELLEAFLQEYEENPTDDADVAQAYATVLQHKQKKRMTGFSGKGKGSGGKSFNFKAHGEMSFDAKAKENRKQAVQFLKSVTPCTSCGQRGHWTGDDACPNTRKNANKPKGGGRGKHKSSASSGTSSSPAKKKAANFFVLHHALESGDENLCCEDLAPLVNEPNAANSGYELTTEAVPENDLTTLSESENGNCVVGSFTDSLALPIHEVLMVFKDTDLCEHCVMNGGTERRLHRGANGHMRYVTCKETDCNKNIIKASRKTPHELWKYMTLVALATKWGSAARSRALFAAVTKARTEDDEERRGLSSSARPSLPLPPARSTASSVRLQSSPSSPGWDLIGEPTSHGSGSGYPDEPRPARILRNVEPSIMIYGLHLSPSREPPLLPPLDDKDLDILQPLPSDDSILGPGTPFEGLTYGQVASSLEGSWYCAQVLNYVLDNTNPLHPETYLFAMYLHCRVKLVYGAAMRSYKSGDFRADKRPADSSSMSTTRQLIVPIQHDISRPDSLQLHDCDVMMVTDYIAQKMVTEDIDEPAAGPVYDQMDPVDDPETAASQPYHFDEARVRAKYQKALAQTAPPESLATTLQVWQSLTVDAHAPCMVLNGPNGLRLPWTSLAFLSRPRRRNRSLLELVDMS